MLVGSIFTQYRAVVFCTVPFKEGRPERLGKVGTAEQIRLPSNLEALKIPKQLQHVVEDMFFSYLANAVDFDLEIL